MTAGDVVQPTGGRRCWTGRHCPRSPDEDAVAAKASWDLKVFNFAGRKDAPSPAEETLKIINRVKETLRGATAAKTQAEATTPPATEPPAPAAPENDPVEVEAEAERAGYF